MACPIRPRFDSLGLMWVNARCLFQTLPAPLQRLVTSCYDQQGCPAPRNSPCVAASIVASPMLVGTRRSVTPKRYASLRCAATSFTVTASSVAAHLKVCYERIAQSPWLEAAGRHCQSAGTARSEIPQTRTHQGNSGGGPPPEQILCDFVLGV